MDGFFQSKFDLDQGTIQELKLQRFVGKEGGVWLAAELKKLVDSFSDQVTRDRRRLHWRDHQATIVLEVLQHAAGRFAGIEITPSSLNGRPVWMYVPAAVNGSGWRRFAYTVSNKLGEWLHGVRSARYRDELILPPPPARLLVEGRSFATIASGGSSWRREDTGMRVPETVSGGQPVAKPVSLDAQPVVRKDGLDWETLLRKLKQVPGWVENW